MSTKRKQISFWRFLLLMAREAIEPIVLALGLALLYSRFQSVSDTVHQTSISLLSAINADSEEHPMIYFTLAIVFVAWVWYKAWKLSKEEKHEREMTEVLTDLRENLEGIRKDIKESKKDD